MSEAFRLGGWGMYPTTIAGFILIACAWRFAMNPARNRLPVVLWLGGLVALTSLLGFTSGCIKTLLTAAQLPPNDLVGTVTQGIGESANNLGLGLSMGVVATIGVIVGHARRPSGPTQLVDPHKP